MIKNNISNIGLKPFQNYHAFRLIDPSEFATFRYEKDKFGDGIDAVWGIRDNGKVDLHTIRFLASKWTFAEAKQWIKEHDFKPILEEEATGERIFGGNMGKLSKSKNYGVKISVIKDLKISDSDGELRLKGYANTKGNKDSYGDIPTAFNRDYVYDLSRYESNPVILLNHENSIENVAGSLDMTKSKEDDIGLYVEAVISNSDYPRIKHARQVYKEGHAKAFSIAGEFLHEDKDNPDHLTLAKIYEISLVPVPADPNSLAVAFDKAYKSLNLSMKTVTEYQDLPLADRDMEWDSTSAIERVRQFTNSTEQPSEDYKKAFLWYDSDALENFGSYKLPIADVVNGTLMAVPRGILSAGGVLQGAMGGVDISEEDKDSVKQHLSKYYAKMDMIPPWEQEQASLNLEEYNDLKSIERMLRDRLGLSQKQAVYLISKIKSFSNRDGNWNQREADKVNLTEFNGKLSQILEEIKLINSINKIRLAKYS